MIGRVHSIESFRIVDGPETRMVIFLSGCSMRCLYRHNPGTRDPKGGTAMTVDGILNQFEQVRSFYKEGGITVSGGESLTQIRFVTELLEAVKTRSIHTCLDTLGITFDPDSDGILARFGRLISSADLVMLDIKHTDPQEYIKLCARPQNNILALARYLEQRRIPVRIRRVAVFGITDKGTYLYRLGQYPGTLKNTKALDVLPYHDTGRAKYRESGIPYVLEDVLPMVPKKAVEIREVILRGMRDARVNCS